MGGRRRAGVAGAKEAQRRAAKKAPGWGRTSPAAGSSAGCSSRFCGSPPPCPWTALAICALKPWTWGGCSWDNRTQVRSPFWQQEAMLTDSPGVCSQSSKP